MTLNLLDYSIIAVYLLLMMAVGFVLRKVASGSIEDYFIGGRKLPWWALGFSGMASFVDITGTTLVTAFLFLLGPKGLYIELRGAVVLMLGFMMIWLGKWHRRSGCITGAGWMTFRFGDNWQGKAASLIMSISMIVTTIVLLAYLAVGVGLFLSTFFPFSPLTCSIVMFSIATIYTIFSGFYGVVVTDVIQSVIILFAVGFVSVLTIVKIGNLDTDIATVASAVTSSNDWTSIVPRWKANLPEGFSQYNLFVVCIGFFMLKGVMQGLGEGADPKYFGARNDKECGLLTFMWIWLFMFRWPLMMAFATLGVIFVYNHYPNTEAVAGLTDMIHAQFPNVSEGGWGAVLSTIINSPDKYPDLVSSLKTGLGDDWQSKVLLLGYNPGTFNAERILPQVIKYFIVPGARGMILIALIAASMSSFDSAVNKAAGFFVKDIYQKFFRPKASDRELIYSSYVVTLLFAVLGILLAVTAKSINDIWGWLMMGLGAGLAMPMILRLYWWRFNGCGFLVGTFTGLVSAVFQRIFFPDMNMFKAFAILTGISLVGSVVGTYLAKPTDEKVIINFYRKTRPFGLWGRFEKFLDPDVLVATKRENKLDLMSAPFVVVWQISLFLIPMQIILLKFDAEFYVSLLVFAVSSFGLYKLWFKRLLKGQ